MLNAITALIAVPDTVAAPVFVPNGPEARRADCDGFHDPARGLLRGKAGRGRDRSGVPQGRHRTMDRGASPHGQQTIAELIMKWITGTPKIDRIACPWLIARFIDERPEFLYVPAGEVLRSAGETGAIPYDIPGVELSHVGELCSFDAFLSKYDLGRDAALQQLASIVRGADTSRLDLTPQSSGLYAMSRAVAYLRG